MLTTQPVIAIEKVAVYNTIPAAYSQCSKRLYSRGQGKMNRQSRILKEAPAVLCTQKNLGYKEKQNEKIKARKKEETKECKPHTFSFLQKVDDSTHVTGSWQHCYGLQWRHLKRLMGGGVALRARSVTSQKQSPKKKNKNEREDARRISDKKNAARAGRMQFLFWTRTRVSKRTPRNHARRIQALTGYRRCSPTYPVIFRRVIEAFCQRPKVNQHPPTTHFIHEGWM